MVSIGLGIALAPRLALTNLRSGISTLRLDPPVPTRRVLLARLAERHPTPAETAAEQLFTTVSHTLSRQALD